MINLSNFLLEVFLLLTGNFGESKNDNPAFPAGGNYFFPDDNDIVPCFSAGLPLLY